MKSIFLAFLTLFIPLAIFAQEGVFETDPNLERCREATVRVHNRNSVGSGTFFMEDEDELFILTNNHVAGTKGNRVKFQMWWKGYLSKEIPGTVVFSVRKANYYRDIAVIAVKKSDLGGYIPPVIPLAPEGYEPQFQRIYSFGCGAGSWLTNWEGHGIDVSNRSGDVINFLPQPAGGRSGSGIFSHDGQYIVALIAWRSEGGQHSLDGNSENPRHHGIAMTFREILLAFAGSGINTSEATVTPNLLELPEYETLENLSTSPDAPSVFRSNIQLDNPNKHEAESVLDGIQLKFYDERANENEPTSNGILVQEHNSKFTQPVPLDSNITQDTFPGLPKNPQQNNPGLPKPEGLTPQEDEPFLFRNAPRIPPKKEDPHLTPTPDPEPTPELDPPKKPELTPDIPESPRLIPKLNPKQEPKIEPKNEEFIPKPIEPKDEEIAPPKDTPESSFNLITWVNENPWMALLAALAIIGWFKALFNWLFIRIAVLTNKEAIRKLVCPSE